MAYLQWATRCRLTDAQTTTIDNSLTSYSAGTSSLHKLTTYPSSLPSMGSEFTLDWARDRIAGKKVAYIATEGIVASSVSPETPAGSVELEVGGTTDQILSRAQTYVVRPVDSYPYVYPVAAAEDAGETGGLGYSAWILVPPAQIALSLAPSDCGLVYGDYCRSWDGNASWNCAAFIGSALTTGQTCIAAHAAATDIFGRLTCTPGNAGNVFISSAISDTWRTHPQLLLNSRGEDKTMSCGGCDALAAHFDRCGAFRNTVWGVMSHDATLQLRIRGYQSMHDWPFGGEVVRDLTPGARSGRRFYAEYGIDPKRYPVLAFEEIGEDLRRFVSEAFEWTSRPKDWQELQALNDAPAELAKARDSFVREVWLGEDNKILTERPQSRTADTNPYTGAEAGLYAVAGQTDEFLANEQATLLMLSTPCTSPCEPTWSPSDIRLFIGDGSVADQQRAAATLKQGNADYNAWCASHPGQCTKTYPAQPVFGLLGDPHVSDLQVATFADNEMCNGTNGQCFAPGASADVGGTPLEDLPVYYVPARSSAEMSNLNGAAYRYHFPTQPPSGEHRYRGLIFLGDRRRVTGEKLQDPEAVAATWEGVLHALGEPVYKILRSSEFPASGAELTKKQALAAEVNGGVSTLVGFEGSLFTRPYEWPGEFWRLSGGQSWAGMMTRAQSMVAVLFGCNMGNLVQAVSALYPNELRTVVFAPSTKTATPFAVASGQSMDLHNYLWSSVLAAELQDSPAGTPWPVIVFNAKNRALAQYPFMLRTLRTVISIGTMVRKHATTTTDVQLGERGDSRLSNTAVLRTLGGPGGRPQIEVSLPRSDDVTLAIYDSRGRLVTTLWNAPMDQGRRTVTWDGFQKDGNPARSGVYFVRLISRTSGTASTKVVVLR